MNVAGGVTKTESGGKRNDDLVTFPEYETESVRLRRTKR